MRAQGARRNLRWLVLGTGLVVCACTNTGPGPAGLGPEPSRGLALADRIESVYKGADWYGSLSLVDGKPEVYVYSAGNDNGVDVPGGEAHVFLGPYTTGTIANEVCQAIAAVVNDPARGPSLSLTSIWVYVGDWRGQCFPPQKP